MKLKIFNILLQNSNNLPVLSSYTILSRRLSEFAAVTKENVTTTKIADYKISDNEQEKLLCTAVENGKVPSIDDWASLKNSVLSKGKAINEINFDARALGYCITKKNFEAGRNLVKYFESKKEKLKVGALGKFMQLCYVCNETDNSISKNDEETILSVYRQIIEQHPVLTSITAENIIPALSLTSEWRKCLDLLNDVKSMTKPNSGSYSFIAKAAFENNDNDLGWKVLKDMIEDEKLPHPSVYKTWLRKIKERRLDVLRNVEILFKFFAQNDILPPKEVTDQSIELLKPLYYTGSYTNITKKGCCESCLGELKKITINEKEFELLRNTFMENVLIGKNIFAKTNPAELEKFNKFLEGSKFDMVIDGLNIAYSAGNKQRPDVYGKMLANVVGHYRLRNSKILVLGRTHMKKWPAKYMEYVRLNAKMFLTQNISQDDPFILYATMKSGLGTNFLSRDYMRGHLFKLLDLKLKKVFKRWQQLHQHTLIYAENNGQVHIKKPFSHLCAAQQFTKGWHIPYVETYLPSPPQSFEVPKNWLCIKKP